MSSTVVDSEEISPPEQRRWRRPRPWEPVFVVALWVLVFASRWGTLRQPLHEAHGFRQTQTALTTRIFHEDGISLLHAKLPVFGAPFENPFEFPFFQATASIPMGWGFGEVASMRATSLAWFCVSATLIYLIVRRWHSIRGAVAATLVFAFSPFAFMWSRASLIEYCATALLLAWILLGGIAIEHRRWSLAGVAAALGGLGAMVKVTTFPAFLLPVIAIAVVQIRDVSRTEGRWRRPDRSLLLITGGLLAVPAVCILWWTRFADRIKAASPFTEWMTSENLRGFNMGTLHQRLQVSILDDIAGRVTSWLIGPWIWVPVAAMAMLATRTRALWIAFALSPFMAWAFFFNLYLPHDYYLAAVSPALAISLGVGLVTAIERLPAVPRIDRRITLYAALVLWAAMIFWYSNPYWRTGWNDAWPPAGSEEITALTDPDDLVIVAGHDWSSEALFTAHRWGLMIRPPHVTRELVAAMPDLARYTLVNVSIPSSSWVDWATIRPWWGPAGTHSFQIGSTADELPDALFKVSADPAPFEAARLTGTPVTLPESVIACGSSDGILLPPGTRDLWLGTEADGTAYFQKVGLPLTPVGAGIVIPVGVDGVRPGMELTCEGGGGIFVRSAVEL